jgi:hypothetical protein
MRRRRRRIADPLIVRLYRFGTSMIGGGSIVLANLRGTNREPRVGR